MAEPVPEVTPRHLRRGPESVPEVAPRHLRLSSSPRLRQLGRKLRLREGPDGKLQLTPEAALVMVPLVVVALVGVLVMAWTVDSFIHAGQVQRNVTVAGSAVGGQPEATLAAEVAEVADAAGQRTVTVVVDGEPVDDVDAVDLGLALDEEAAVEGAMDAGRGSLLAQPFSWSRSLFNDHEVPLDYTVDEAELTNSLGMLYLAGIGDADDVVAFQNPRIDLTDGEFVLVPGQPGSGLDLDRASVDLAAAAGSTDGPFDDIVLDVETDELAPSITDEQAQALVDEANSLTEGGLAVVAEDVEGSLSSEQTLSTEQLRSWITPVLEPAEAGEIEGVDPDELEELSLHFDTAAAGEAVAELFAEIGEEPTNATVALTDGSIEVVESQSGVACCAGDAGAQVWSALNDGEGELTVEAEVVEPEITTEDAEGWGIVEPVGGSRGWQAGAEVEQGPRPGYTTWEVGGGGRAHNIETIVGEINGAVILPGETWSINDHVGARECPPYQAAGAIVEGEHEDVCGGGISQVGTTLLNAAYFAGLDVTGQAHSEYFSRYPQGREATMGAPGTPLDVTIENTTPYGIYIQAARHGDEVTFTIWSTEHIVVEDLGVDQMGTCITVTNTRQRTFPDGRVETDQFTAVYRPGEGIQC